MQVVYRFRLVPHRVEEFVEWLEANQESLVSNPREGWTYLGTWFVLQNLGDYDAESRWELDDYSAFGAGFGGEETVRLITEYLDFVDPATPMVGTPMKSLSDVRALPGS